MINNCPAFAISQEYFEQIDFALASLAAAIVARNILEHGLKRGELISVNVPAVSIDDCEGSRSPASGGASTRTSSSLRVDPRGIPYYWLGGPPPSGISVPGHRLQRGGQPAGVGDADPPRPHGPEPAAQAQGVGLVDLGATGSGDGPAAVVLPPPSGADAAEEARIAEESQLERR